MAKKNEVRIYHSQVGGHQPEFSMNPSEYLVDADIPKLDLSKLHYHPGDEEEEEPGYYSYPVGSNPDEIPTNWGVERTGIDDTWDLFTWGVKEGSDMMKEVELFAEHCKERLGRTIIINCY